MVIAQSASSFSVGRLNVFSDLVDADGTKQDRSPH